MGGGLRIIQGDEFIVLRAKGQLRAVIERNFVGPHQCKEVRGALGGPELCGE